MLCLIGIGLTPKQLTLEALEEIKNCEKVYLENYTSKYSSGKRDEFEDIIGKAVTEVGRKIIEEGFSEILEEAREKNVALLVFGSPLNATTHVQLLLDAKQKEVQTKTIPGISIFEMVSFCGLDRYKFGRTTTLVFHESDYEPESFYDAILENKKIGLHTLCLLDIKKDEEKMMSIGHAVSLLEMIENKREKAVISESVVVGLAGMGSDAQQLKAGTTEQAKGFRFTSYPQSLIICGKLNEKEIEALALLAGLE